ncbi:hypothetical protein SVIOM74S_06916 [Streptomyces violarus]
MIPVATKNTFSPVTRSSVVRTRSRSWPASIARCRSSSSLGHSLPWIVPPRHFTAHAEMMPSGVPPMPSSRSTPVPSRSARIEPATSPSEISLIRAPVSRISLMMPSCRGRSRITTVTSSGADRLALATRRMFTDTGALMSTKSAASGPVTSLSM